MDYQFGMLSTVLTFYIIRVKWTIGNPSLAVFSSLVVLYDIKVNSDDSVRLCLFTGCFED